MPDREKVIKALTDVLSAKENYPLAKAEMSFEFIEILLELLKEQEAVEPYVDGEVNYCCGACDTVVGWEELTEAGMTPYVYKFCPMCGKGVQWNDGKRL